MRLAVLIPAYNRPTLLVEALETVAAQERPPDRVVVVDDASEDDTADRGEAWIAGRPGWELVRSERNGGVAVARNAGLARLGDCDAIAFLDCDDLWPPSHLAQLEEALARRPDAVAAVTDVRVFRHTLPEEGALRPTRWVETDLLDGLFRKAGFTPSAMAVRRDECEAIEGFDASVGLNEDMDFCLRLSLRGPFVHALGPPIFYRRDAAEDRNESTSLMQLSKRGSERRVRILERFAAMEGAPSIRGHLAWARYRAARDALREGRRSDAREHCVRALRYRPWYPRPAFCFLRTLLPVSPEK